MVSQGHRDQGQPDAGGGRRPGRHRAARPRSTGYRVAGKTGTADRYDADLGGYSGFTASFIGYAPADDPKYVVAVTLQRPVQGHFGGQLGAPVFKDVMTYALQKAQIPPDQLGRPRDPAQLGGRGLGPQRPGGPQR